MASDGLRAGPHVPWLGASGFLRAVTASAAVAVGSMGGCGTVTSVGGGPSPPAGDAAAGTGSGFGVSGDASSCQVGAVDTYVPGLYQPATGAWQGVCVASGQDLIGQYYDACFGNDATPAACGAFKATSSETAMCAACILTPVSATRLGPIIDYGGFVGRNTAGCIQLADPDGMPCATAVQALTGCELQACQANCPVTSVASLQAYLQCAADADSSGCASYSAMAACGQALDGGPASICDSAAFKDFYDAVVPLFCGQRATLDVDAGSSLYPPFTDGSAATVQENDAAAVDSEGSAD